MVLLLLNVLLSGQHVCLCSVAPLDLSVHTKFLGGRSITSNRRMRAQEYAVAAVREDGSETRRGVALINGDRLSVIF